MPRRLSSFATVVVSAALVVTVAGCTTGDVTSTTTTSTSTLPPATTTTLTPASSAAIGVQLVNFNFNPLSGSRTDAQRVIGNAVWATVYDIDPATWERIPDAVLALPSQVDGGIETNDDGSMTVRYQVDPKARWSDGVPITGADLAFTAEAMRDLALDGNSAVDPVMGTVTKVESAQNVAWITLSEQTLAFEEAFWVILPSHALENLDLATDDGFKWPSGGPFVGVPGTSGTKLVANPFYWKVDDQGRRLPLIESVTFVPYLSDQEELFNDGEVDVVELDGPPTNIEPEVSDGGVEIQKVPTPILEHLTFNFRATRGVSNPDSLNSNTAFRQSIAMSIDPSIYISSDLVYFDGEPPGVLTPRDGSSFSTYQFNTSLAREQINELGVANPSSVINTTSNGELRIDIAESLVAPFRASGVDLTPAFVDSVVFYGDVLPSGTFDVGMWALENDGGFHSTMALLDLLDPAGQSDGYSGWGQGDAANEQTARFSEIAAEARTVTNADEFDSLVLEAEGILGEEVPVLPLFQRASYAAIRADRISGVRHNATASRFTWNIEQWSVAGQ